MEAGDEQPTMNLKQVAASLGVHYMTAYRYVRTGRIEGEKIGTEWVIAAAAVARFATPDAISDEQNERPRADWTARLAQALVTGDEATAWRVLQQALASGRTPAECYLDLLSGALRQISSPDNDEGSDEYLATATAGRLVARLGARFRRSGRSRGTVVFGAPSGELHSLPIAIVADLVRLDGFTCLELGANVPPRAFAHAAARAPRLVAVGIGVTTAANIDAVVATIDAVRAVAPEVPVLLGGQAVRNPEVAAMAGATHWAADGAEALTIINELGDARPTRTRTHPTMPPVAGRRSQARSR